MHLRYKENYPLEKYCGGKLYYFTVYVHFSQWLPLNKAFVSYEATLHPGKFLEPSPFSLYHFFLHLFFTNLQFSLPLI